MKMFKPIVFLLFCCMIAVISSCKKKEPPVTTPTSSFTLQLKAKYGTQAFALNSPNIDTAGRYVTINLLQFYLSHINLIKTDNSTVPLASAVIVDFSDTTTLSITVNNVTGNFTGISFGCGLDSNQNKANPNDSIFPNPYSGYWNTYWSMIGGYQFEVLDGKWSASPTSNMPNVLAYHIGTNAAYRTTQLNKSFSVCCGTNYTLPIYLDVEKIFYNSTTGDTINIVTEYQTSSGTTATGDNPAIMPAFANNFSNAFTF